MKKDNKTAPITNAMASDPDDWQVRDGVHDTMRYHQLTQNKPLFRKVKKHIRHAARMISRKGGR